MCVAVGLLITFYIELNLACIHVLNLPDAERCIPTATVLSEFGLCLVLGQGHSTSCYWYLVYTCLDITASDFCGGSGLEELCEEVR